MRHTSDDPEKCEVCGPLLRSLKITEEMISGQHKTDRPISVTVQVGFREATEQKALCGCACGEPCDGSRD